MILVLESLFLNTCMFLLFIVQRGFVWLDSKLLYGKVNFLFV